MYKINAAQAIALNALSTAVSNVHYNLRKVEESAVTIRDGLEKGTYIPYMDTTGAVDLGVSTAMLRNASDWVFNMFPDMHEDNVADLIKKVRLNAFKNNFHHYAEGREI